MKKLLIFVPAIALFGASCDSIAGSQDASHTSQGDEPSAKSINVVWKDYNGSILEIDFDLKSGEVPHFDGRTPERQTDDENKYIFAGWDKDVGPIYETTEYVATYSVSKREYKITWYQADGSLISV